MLRLTTRTGQPNFQPVEGSARVFDIQEEVVTVKPDDYLKLFSLFKEGTTVDGVIAFTQLTRKFRIPSLSMCFTFTG